MKSIYMDERWGILQQEKENGEARLYTFEREGIRIVYPFIKRKAGVVDDVEYFDIATPRGQCGPWFENCGVNNRDFLIEEFNKDFSTYCNNEKIIAEYIRFSPWINNFQYFSKIYSTRMYGELFCNNLTIDFFKDEYSKKKRNEVRKAERNGVEVLFDVDHSSVEDFLRLYAYTESKYEFGEYYKLDKGFIERYLDVFLDEVVFAKAIYKGEIISMAIILLGDDIAHYHFAANNPEFLALEGNSLLIYKATQLAAQKGKKLFDLGGAAKGSSLEKFKKKFVEKGNIYPYYVGEKIRNKAIYDELVSQVGGPRKGYFPEYRR